MSTTSNNLSDPKTKQSEYAKFHFAFLGYQFKDKSSGKVYTKLKIFYKDKLLAKLMAEIKEPSSNYELVNSPGWKNGNLLTNPYL